MVHVSQLPCNGGGMCMQCNEIPTEEEKLYCKTCATPWHVECLARPPESLASTLQWECPDCAGDVSVVVSGQAVEKGGIVAEILAIQADASLTESEKARRRQELMSGNSGSDGGDETKRKKEKGKDKVVDGGENEELNIFDGNLKCSFCINILERPVTTPCGHNFCLKCFQKWIGLGKDTCATCRCRIPYKMASQPRINSTLVAAIRMANSSKSTVSGGPSKVYHYVHNQDRPDKAYTTERAKKNGKANAASGKIFVTVPPDHFGPILAESDPVRNQGVLIGELWEGRLECRQWGVHYPPVAGIAGQAKHGAQSVVLSGGYEDDEDHGEWFLYTGSGGRDLSGNKRTNMNQSFDQKFEKMNEALRVSCKKGYPVRVVRSFKEKRSSYAPEKGLRYDGIYRIEECWRKVGIQGFKVCRYLFVRCDNDPAPWTSDEHGDRPRPLPIIPEIKNAFDITKRKESPSWDFDVNGCWKWIKPPPLSRAVGHKGTSVGNNRPMGALKKGQHKTIREKLLKEFSCLICKQVMAHPVTTPCAHNFCKLCLEGAFAGQSFVRERSNSVRMLRAQKNIMKCPSCANDISDFLKDTQVNRELMEVIESLKKRAEDNDELTEETGEEETDVSEGIPDPTPESSNSCGENHEETGVNGGGSKNPTMTCKPERANKRKKVDVGDCSEESGENHEETSVIGSSQNPTMTCKPERVNESKKVDVEGNTVKKSDREENRTATEKVDSEAGKLEAGNVHVGTKEMEAEAALKEGNDSPASPFLMASDGQDSSWLSD